VSLFRATFFLRALDSSSSEEDCRFLFDVVTSLLAFVADVLSRVVAVNILRVEVRQRGVEADEELFFLLGIGYGSSCRRRCLCLPFLINEYAIILLLFSAGISFWWGKHHIGPPYRT
jgi:hypothetical protein